MSQDFLITSAIPWFRNNADDVIQNIVRATFGRDVNMQPSDLFRPSDVNDAESRHGVPVAYERLTRWAAITNHPGGDLEHPNNVFHIGFLPRARPAQGQYPATEFNLAQYVATNTESIFIGTTRYTRNAQGRLSLWERRLTQATQHRFQYEIFAYGGIDVNHVLGNDHEYANQHEVAFPGGIRPQFIRSAREFQGTRVVAVWDNPRFEPSANGQHSPTWDRLPHVIRGTQVPVYFFTERDRGILPSIENPQAHHDELRRRRREAGFNEDEDDIMHGQGDQTIDELVGVTPTPRLSRACFLRPNGGGRSYFFSGNQYCIITVKPGTTGDTLDTGPRTIIGYWPSLLKARFGNIDAILPNPNNPTEEAYFFCGTQYALIKTELGTTNDSIINGPKTIVNEWPSLKQAGFSTVDAVLPHPTDKSEAYFFSDTKYALIKINPGTNSDSIVNGPKVIINEWPSLKKAGFATVDAVLPNPNDSNEAYFFSGSQYARINVKPGTNNDFIVYGPKSVADNWPSLKKALFY